MFQTASAMSGGWVIVLVLALPQSIETKSSPSFISFLSPRYIMCGNIPFSNCAEKSERISCFASSVEKCESAIAWKQESQSHWNGYDSGDGTVY